MVTREANWQRYWTYGFGSDALRYRLCHGCGVVTDEWYVSKRSGRCLCSECWHWRKS